MIVPQVWNGSKGDGCGRIFIKLVSQQADQDQIDHHQKDGKSTRLHAMPYDHRWGKIQLKGKIDHDAGKHRDYSGNDPVAGFHVNRCFLGEAPFRS